MADPAIAKVEDAIAAVLTAQTGVSQALDGWTILTDQSIDVAVPEDKWPAIAIFTTSYSFEQSDELNQSMHTARIEFEFITGGAPFGTLNRLQHTAIANAHAAIAADRTIGGRLHDLQEVDVAPAQAGGKDASSASLQYIAEFFTPRDDWFTIIGQAGQEF